jgi:SAM-dependent methyltransferase
MTHRISADAKRLTLTGPAIAPGTVIAVLLSGRRVWTFRSPEADTRPVDGVLEVPWPAALAERLTGRATVRVLSSGEVLGESEVRFDSSDDDFTLVEPGTGVPQAVNKWGRVARTFEGSDLTLLDEVFEEVERLVSLVAEHAGIDLFVTGGTLLGPVRDGRILPSDDDADLAYLSAHGNPSDVALESFALERTLAGAGYEVVRHSTGHLQLLFPGGTATDRFYLDIFTYFRCNGFFYGTFHARQPQDRVPILPLHPFPVHGRMLPAPAEPERLLEAIYGPEWAVPDPAFAFSTPPAAARRFFSWLDHFDTDRENWEDRHRVEQQSGAASGPSELGLAVARALPPGSSIVELGCGSGADALHLAATGHRVLAVDFSRPALAFARMQSALPEDRLRYERVNLASTREAVRLRQLATDLEAPVHVVARHLFDALGQNGWDTTLRFLRSVLADGGRAFVEAQLEGPERLDVWTGYSFVDIARLRGALHRAGLTIETEETLRIDSTGTTVCRLIVRSTSP